MDRPVGGWLELSATVGSEAVEAVSEIFARVATGITVEAAFVSTDEGLGARLDPTRPAVVRAYLDAGDATATEAAVTRTETALGHLQAFGLGPIGELQRRAFAPTDWAASWKQHFPLLRIGRRIVIRPAWRRHRRRPGDVVLALDPGQAFGTGLHPTTRLCLEGVERLAEAGSLDGARVLDVGCGSGILALAAAGFGARRVLGLDTDPLAVEATRRNARRNRCARRVRARLGSLPVPDGPYDVVLANLIGSLLIALSEPLREAMRPGGRLVAGGIFADRERDVRRALRAAGLRPTGRLTEGEWVTLEVERPA
ncbi:MAG TPA: 50S ribosomal protein L11 methyltransferase [Candidatus Sulfotelmatobacter sp.]|nr:50S ribosomal protein L11 methyltransferase [Candidatus Sulfotelmatobacter sp.]